MRRVFRGIIDAVVEGAIKRISLKGVAGEQLSDREIFQHYGFTSRPLAGAEGIVIREGNCFYVIAEDDRRYRIALEDGEVCIFDDQGQAVHLKRDKHIHIYGAEKLTADIAKDVIVNTTRAQINASESCIVTSPLVKAVASSKVVLQTPLTEMTGNADIAGNLSVAGTGVVTGALSSATSVSDPTGTMQAMRGIYNGHNHNENGDGGGITDSPTQQM